MKKTTEGCLTIGALFVLSKCRFQKGFPRKGVILKFIEKWHFLSKEEIMPLTVGNHKSEVGATATSTGSYLVYEFFSHQIAKGLLVCPQWLYEFDPRGLEATLACWRRPFPSCDPKGGSRKVVHLKILAANCDDLLES